MENPGSATVPTDGRVSSVTEPWSHMITGLSPIRELQSVVESALGGLGLTEVAWSPELSAAPPRVDLSVLHFIILPRQSAWLDIQFEADRDSANAVFTAMSGEAASSEADLEDVLRETMNLIHGGLKSAFKQAGIDVIVPVVPQSIETARLAAGAGSPIVHRRLVFTAASGVKLRLTLGARRSPVTHKLLRQLRQAQVLIDPLTPEQSPDIIIVKQHTMLNERMVEKIHRMAECEATATMHAVVEPSPLAELIGKR